MFEIKESFAEWKQRIFFDHGFLRAIYPNIWKIDKNFYRSAQPSPSLFLKFKNKGIKTIINLRGSRDDLVDQMEHFDCLVIDSFQALSTSKKMNTREFESYAVTKLTKAAKDTECTVFFIMHLTKAGLLKGSTLVPHSVDVNMQIEIDADVSDDARRIYFNKNRFGPCNELTVYLGAKGYDFSAPIVIEDEDKKAPSKKNKKQKELDIILEMKEPPHINVNRVMESLEVDYMRANYLLRDLVNNNKLVKFGRGKGAVYKTV